MSRSGDPSVSNRNTLVLLHIGFVVTGVFTVLLGPVLPLLAQRWSLTDSQTGNFFTAQFGGLLAGVALSSYLLKNRYRPAFVSGFALMGAGALALGRGPWETALPSLFCMGFGNGFITAATNLWVGEAMPEAKARALSFVNFSWTFGAVSCPFIFQAFASPRAFTQALVAISGAALLLAVVFAGSQVDAIRWIAGPKAAAGAQAGKFDRSAIIFALLFFLYVGAETAAGGWLATYSRRVSTSSGTAWILTPAFFWGGMMVGRGSGTLALRHIPERPVVQAGSLFGLCGLALLTQSKSLGLIYASSFVTGLGFSVIFPILFAWMAGHYGAEARRVTGFMLTIAELGAATLPWVVGVISAASGSIRIGLAVLLVDIFGVFIFASLIHLPSPVPLDRAGRREIAT